MAERLTPDFVMVTKLEEIPEIDEKIYPLRPAKNAAPPFAFYIQDTDNEDETLCGLSSLQHTGFKIHLVTDEYRELAIMGSLIKAKLNQMQGQIWTRADGGPVGAVMAGDAVVATSGDDLLIERVRVTQTSPDLYETEVGWFRRIYDVDFDYQTERSEGT